MSRGTERRRLTRSGLGGRDVLEEGASESLDLLVVDLVESGLVSAGEAIGVVGIGLGNPFYNESETFM